MTPDPVLAAFARLPVRKRGAAAGLTRPGTVTAPDLAAVPPRPRTRREDHMRRHNRKAEGRVAGLDADEATAGAAGSRTRPQPTEEDVRVRAYHLWERAGRPPGDGVGYWLAAEHEMGGGGR